MLALTGFTVIEAYRGQMHKRSTLCSVVSPGKVAHERICLISLCGIKKKKILFSVAKMGAKTQSSMVSRGP